MSDELSKELAARIAVIETNIDYITEKVNERSGDSARLAVIETNIFFIKETLKTATDTKRYWATTSISFLAIVISAYALLG